MWRPPVSLRSSIYTVAWSSLLIPLVVLVLALRALALDSEPDPAPSGDMNREPADPEPKMEEASTASRRGRPGHIEREAAASCRGRHFGHTVDARQAPRHVVRQRGYLCHLWQ